MHAYYIGTFVDLKLFHSMLYMHPVVAYTLQHVLDISCYYTALLYACM